jgi:translation elongation factor EF-1alpha
VNLPESDKEDIAFTILLEKLNTERAAPATIRPTKTTFTIIFDAGCIVNCSIDI